MTLCLGKLRSDSMDEPPGRTGCDVPGRIRRLRGGVGWHGGACELSKMLVIWMEVGGQCIMGGEAFFVGGLFETPRAASWWVAGRQSLAIQVLVLPLSVILEGVHILWLIKVGLALRVELPAGARGSLPPSAKAARAAVLPGGCAGH